jgi:hypothetical protein
MFEGITEKKLKKIIDEATYNKSIELEINVMRGVDPNKWEVQITKRIGPKEEIKYLEECRGFRKDFRSLDRMIANLKKLGVTHLNIVL